MKYLKKFEATKYKTGYYKTISEREYSRAISPDGHKKTGGHGYEPIDGEILPVPDEFTKIELDQIDNLVEKKLHSIIHYLYPDNKSDKSCHSLVWKKGGKSILIYKFTDEYYYVKLSDGWEDYSSHYYIADQMDGLLSLLNKIVYHPKG